MAGALKCRLNEPRAVGGPCCGPCRRNAYGCAARRPYRAAWALARDASLRSLGAVVGRLTWLANRQTHLAAFAQTPNARPRNRACAAAAGVPAIRPAAGCLHPHWDCPIVGDRRHRP
ncbi:protein of unknown function [Cupriavidus taiwanensis]|nr:protein of unknown function [Cupriavidus taiwanensis]